MVRVGDKAPDFSLPTADGTSLRLKDLKGTKVVLYFYPKDMTSGCTAEACSFQKELPSIKKKKAIVIGVSADSVASHQKFSSQYGLSFALLSDTDKSMAKAYGAWKEKSMYGKKYMGIERTTFLIDERGYVLHIFSKVKVKGHTEEVLAIL
jgi:peroxiredoxin Q/BCP